MKTAAIRKLRQKLAKDEPVHGLWVTLESASITEMAVALGMDWVVIDAEHGHLDWKDILEHLRATVRSDTVALVRIAELNIGLIKRALDIGADGVVVPWVESSEQLAQAVQFAHYPPQGLRGIGAERATCWGQCFGEHVNEANEHVLVVPIIETVRAGNAVHELLEVPGVELYFFGPADYSSTAGYRGQWEGPGVAEQILAAKDAIRAKGRHCGVVATDNDNLAVRREQGFRMLGVGLDAGLLLRSLRGSLKSVGRDRTIRADFEVPATGPSILPRPPESMRPDRPEVMNAVGSGVKRELAEGVHFECLVGAHNQSRNLTTGIVTVEQDAVLPYHRHTFGESVTVLSGSVTMAVEGRRYVLTEMDNIVIPAGHVHQLHGPTGREPATLHVAMASHEPARELVSRFYSWRAMADDSTGVPGGERVNRFKTAPRFEAGPNATFINFFNSDLMPGFDMSGGYGLFGTGGRLPAHVHDFDESICIVQGNATCVVEGRRYEMSDLATALQPRGRVHYFINETQSPMAMLWVYAGPVPERIVVDESCATVQGNPWRDAAKVTA
jgi:2-dehydro-3-deoxyglucarate aldolase/4-hydroxy-2-oxoheptanedioate aldolase